MNEQERINEEYAISLMDTLKKLEVLRRIRADLQNDKTTIGSIGPDDGYTAGDVLGLFPEDLVDNPGDLGPEKAKLVTEAFVKEPLLMVALLAYYEVKADETWKTAKAKVIRKSTLEEDGMQANGREINNIVMALKAEARKK